VGTATTGYKGVLVDRTITMGDGIDDGLVTSGTITLSSAFTIYGAFRGYNNEGGSGKSTFGKSSIDGNVFRFTGSVIGGWIGAGGATLVSQSANVLLLNLATMKRKQSDNTLQINNGTEATNTNSIPVVNSPISIFSTTLFGSSNALFTTGIISNLEDNSTPKTNMYNYIRSINNNAF
jgi:hypothetical protein